MQSLNSNNDTSEINLAEAYAIPSAWVKLRLGEDLYDWQAEIMDDVVYGGKPFALAAANGTGKTSKVLSLLVLWHGDVFQNDRSVLTAGVYRQVKDIYHEIKKRAHKFPGIEILESEVRFPSGTISQGYSTDDPGAFEGKHSDNLLIIADEAKSISDGIAQAIERCQPKYQLICSSTGRDSGFFFEAFHKQKNFYNTRKITAFDCPHISKRWIDEQTAKWGEQHPLIRSMIYSEFVNLEDKPTIMTKEMVRKCLENPPVHKKGKRLAFFDFAAGGDYNVIAVSDGNKMFVHRKWREENTMAMIGECIRELKKLEIPAQFVWGDYGGMGIPIIQRFEELGFPINPVNFGSTDCGSDYTNKSAEMWWTTRMKIENCEVIIPEDEDLMNQLTTRRIEYSSKGLLGLESKQKMRERGLASPDVADAICGLIEVSSYWRHQKSEVKDEWMDEPTEQQKYKGFYAG